MSSALDCIMIGLKNKVLFAWVCQVPEIKLETFLNNWNVIDLLFTGPGGMQGYGFQNSGEQIQTFVLEGTWKYMESEEI